MKKILLLFLLKSSCIFSQAVGIGTTNPDSKAILDIVSDDKGMLIPRLLLSQRLGIQPPIPVGLMVYQTNGEEGFYYFDGFSWSMVGKGGNFWTADLYGLFNTTLKIGIGTSAPDVKLSIDGGIEANLSDGSGYLLIGNIGDQNLVFDENEIQSRIDASSNKLLLNPAGGNVGIGTNTADTKLHIDGGSDASLSGGGYLQTGPTSGKNLLFDDNEILARNNGNADQLIIQNSGGNTLIGGNVRVEGKLGIDADADVQLHIRNGSDAGLTTTTTGFFQMGATDGTNIIMDNNEIMARNNGATSDLILQNDGGRTLLGGDLEIDGVVKGAFKLQDYLVTIPANVANNEYTVNVGNKTFILINNLDPNNGTAFTKVFFSDGEAPGQLLIVALAMNYPIRMDDENIPAATNYNVDQLFTLGVGGTATFVWDGNTWLLLGRSDN